MPRAPAWKSPPSVHILAALVDESVITGCGGASVAVAWPGQPGAVEQLSQPLVSRIGGSPLWRAGLASAFILGLAGFAAGVVPQACRAGFVICPANAPGAAAAALDLTPAVVEEAPVAAPVEVAAIAAPADSIQSRQPASLTKNDLIARTFAALDPEFTLTPGELTARKVRTVAIGPDGMPITEAAPVAAAPSEEPAPIVVADVEEPEPVSAAAEAAPVTEAAGPEEEPTASAYAPVSRGTAIIGRQGANVRSQPSTRSSEVLFALASGQEVTITETSKGWSKVVDDRGRSGWIWGELLRR